MTNLYVFIYIVILIIVGPTLIAQARALATPTLIALVVSGAVFLLFAALLLLFCRCRRKHAAKAKDYEMDTNAWVTLFVTNFYSHYIEADTLAKKGFGRFYVSHWKRADISHRFFQSPFLPYFHLQPFYLSSIHEFPFSLLSLASFSSSPQRYCLS